jgi:glucose/arabinose dehydrogenase/plastocyanin
MRARFVLSSLLALIWSTSSLLVSSGQDATPVPPSERPPGQYAFFPAEVAQSGGDLPGDPQVQLVKVVDGLFEPVNVAAPRDGSGRLFILERAGVIRTLDSNGELLPDPFLDISDITEYQFLEEGLLGMAFHPDFANNGLFYINYTNQLRNGDVLTVQYRVSTDDPNKADLDTALIVSERDQPFPNHIGGDIEFGPDGFLYIGHGDGGLEGDPLDAGQDLTTHLGKMLRIDVTPAVNAVLGQNQTQAAVGGKAYNIPADNPLVQGDIIIDLFNATEDDFARFHPYALPEIWDWGLRNPWQFSFDRETGDLWIGDVGQNFWEEVNFEPAGSGGGFNYGWKFLQGSHCFPISMDPDCPKVGTLPVAEYPHADALAQGDPGLGCTVVGGSVYRGSVSTSLTGIYFHSDYCSGRIWGLQRDDAGTWQYQELLDTGLLVTGSGEDEAGEIYFTSCDCGYGQAAPHQEGALWKLVQADQAGDAEVAPGNEEATPSDQDEEAEEGTPAGEQGTPVAGEGEQTVNMVDLAFDPTELTIPAGTDVTITLVNNGALEHNFVIDALGVQSDTVSAGGTTTVTINAEAGDYEFYCGVPGHKEAGMVGTLHLQ